MLGKGHLVGAPRARVPKRHDARPERAARRGGERTAQGDEAPPRSRRPVEVIRVARVRDAVRRLAIHRCAPEGDVGEVAGSRWLAGPRQRPVGGVRVVAVNVSIPFLGEGVPEVTYGVEVVGVDAVRAISARRWASDISSGSSSSRDRL